MVQVTQVVEAQRGAHADGRMGTECHTEDDLLRISTDSSHRYALVRGELIIMSPAGFRHGELAMHLGARLWVYAEDHKLGIVCTAETGFKLESNPDTVLAPDAAFVRQERLPAGKLPVKYFPGPPDLAVEVVSPNDSASEVSEKVQAWLSFGTRLVWVVEPQTQTVAVYRPDGSAQVLGVDDTLRGKDVLPGFQYELNRLFA
jgi:Uma2 family endonuclease